MPRMHGIILTILLATATTRADDAGTSRAAATPAAASAVPPSPPPPRSAPALPSIDARNITEVTFAIEGEEGEHAEVRVARSGVVTLGRSHRGSGGGLPVLRPSVRRVRNPGAFLEALARTATAANFPNAPESDREPRGRWHTLTIRWAGVERTRTVGAAGVSAELVRLVMEATGVSMNGMLP